MSNRKRVPQYVDCICDVECDKFSFSEPLCFRLFLKRGDDRNVYGGFTVEVGENDKLVCSPEFTEIFPIELFSDWSWGDSITTILEEEDDAEDQLMRMLAEELRKTSKLFIHCDGPESDVEVQIICNDGTSKYFQALASFEASLLENHGVEIMLLHTD